MRISDWSSDVCSSDLLAPNTTLPAPQPNRLNDWTLQSSSANLAVTQAELAAKIVEKQIDIAKSQHYPTLSLRAQTGSASDRGLYYPNGGPRSVDSTIGVQLSIPIFTGRSEEHTSELQSLMRNS